MLKRIFPLSLLFLSFNVSNVYADGGSGISCKNLTSACPAGQSGSITWSFSATGSFNGCSDVQKRIDPYNNKFARITSNTCVDNTPAPPVVAPPVSTPDPVAPTPTPEVPVVVVPPPTVIPPTVPQVSVPSNYDSLCSEGYTGRITHTFSVYYTMETYSTVMSDGTPTTAQASTPHVSESVTNNCVIIPTQQTKTDQTVQEQTCDSYYNAPSGTYYGTVYKYITNTSTYDQNSKTTNTTSVVNNYDISSCAAQFIDTSLEKRTKDCPSGQSGSVEEYRYVATSSTGATIYPYGGEWLTSNNSCSDTQIAADTTNTEDVKPNGLLSNISVTSSALQNENGFQNYIDSLSSNSWSTNNNHKLIINIEDLSNQSYKPEIIGTAISSFQKTVGIQNADVEIKIPKTIDKFIGIDQITETNVNSGRISLKSVDFENGNAVIKYFDLGVESTGQPKELVSTINIIPNNVNLTGVSGS